MHDVVPSWYKTLITCKHLQTYLQQDRNSSAVVMTEMWNVLDLQFSLCENICLDDSCFNAEDKSFAV
jgi:hypothetical protein